MRSSDVTAGNTIYASDLNKLRDDAFASSWLLAHEQTSPDLTLKVENGTCYINNVRIDFAGGNSPSFTAPATNPRIDILSLNASGILVRTAGTEAVSPVAPTEPTNSIIIAYVYNRVGQTSIKDTDDSTNGYIYKDTRPFIDKNISVKKIYTSNDTWVKPDNLKSIKVICLGGGGSGASGSARIASTSFNIAGGAGGGGGAISEMEILADNLPSTVSVTVAQSKAGGAGVTVSGTSLVPGNDGLDGDASSFGTYVVANGGKKGTNGGGTSSGSNGGTGGYSKGFGTSVTTDSTTAILGQGGQKDTNAENGGAGGGGCTTYTNSSGKGKNGGGSIYGAGGGGGGGSMGTGAVIDATTKGGDGGKVGAYSLGGGGAGGGDNTFLGNGASGSNGTQYLISGTGGGGGSAYYSASGNAGAGGNGVYGGGGGGGGALGYNTASPGGSTTAYSGAGGAGGAGLVIITEFY